VIRASANATRLPIETTLPSARTGPVVRRRRAAVRIGHVDAALFEAKELTHPDTHPILALTVTWGRVRSMR